MADYQHLYVDVSDVTRSMERLASLQGGKGERIVRRLFVRLLAEARKKTSARVSTALDNDPRKAAKAVRSSAYKKIVGGQLNIFQKRKAGTSRPVRQSARKTWLGKAGGNRLKRSDRTNQVDGYYGADRGFILRFVNQGTSERQSRYGARERIEGKKFFEPAATAEMYALIGELKQQCETIAQELWGE